MELFRTGVPREPPRSVAGARPLGERSTNCAPRETPGTGDPVPPASAIASAVYDVVVSSAEAADVVAELRVTPAVSSVVSAEPDPVDFAETAELPGGKVHLRVPRFYGYDRFGVPPRVRRALHEGSALHGSVSFRGELASATSQRAVLEAITEAWRGADPRRHGVRITVPCGFGKTVIALAAIAEHGRRALVVAPNTVLVAQWCERVAQFLPEARVHQLRSDAGSVTQSRTWLIPGTAAEDVERSLSIATRKRTVAAADFGRRIAVRGGEVCAVSVDGDAVDVHVDHGPTWIHLRRAAEAPEPPGATGAPDGSVRVAISLVESRPPYEEVASIPDGVLVRCQSAKQARSNLRRLGDAGKRAVPAALLAEGSLPAAFRTERPVDVAVVTVQALSMCEFDPSMLRQFGVLVVDEVHSVCARVFSGAMRSVPCARLLALSATPERRDGMHTVLPWHCGPEIVRIHRTFECVDVRALTYRGGDCSELRFRGGQLRVADMVSRLVADGERSRRIAALVAKLRDEGREVIVLGERVGHLRDLAGRIGALVGDECGVLCGETPQRERAAQAARSIVLATYPLCRQGFDKPRLDTLVMVTPVTAIEQCVGRILRSHPSKQPPLVVDIVDPYSLFMGEARKRRRQYDAWGYNVTDSTLDAPIN